MKKLFILAIAAIGLLACNGKNEPENSDNSKNSSISATISCDPTSKTVDAAGGEFTVTITSNAAWSATADKSWVTVSPNSGQGDAFVTVKVAAANNDEARILFSNGNSSATLIVKLETQAPAGGLLSGKFSVSASKQVQFSQGNLQYQASTQTWRFAEKQYDIIGSSNTNISSAYSGWIDMFGWGTGNNPTLSSEDNNDYTTFVDWGTNAISNGGNQANLWRTLTKDEWKYLFETRTNASNKYGQATVAGVHGIIALPDVYNGAAINNAYSAWENNTISASDWAVYEANGAVFLPAAGRRIGTDMDEVGSFGRFWSSTPFHEDCAIGLIIYSDGLAPQDLYGRSLGISVRLVKDVQSNCGFPQLLIIENE